MMSIHTRVKTAIGAAAVFCSFMSTGGSAGAETIRVTDLAGRTLTVDAPVERVILSEGRQLYVVATLDTEDPFKRVIGWRDDLKRADLNGYNQYLDKFPAAADIPIFGNANSGGFSAEQAVALNPDLVVLHLGALKPANESGLLEQLEAAGIPAVFIDFRERPLENTIPSTLLLGRLFGKEERAQEVVSFYLGAMNQVYSRVEDFEEKPTVFVERSAGTRDECCRTWGRESLGLLVERAGGINIGSDLLPGATGTISAEKVLSADPEVAIMTGTNWSLIYPDNTAVSLGADSDGAAAIDQLKGLADRTAYATTAAVKNGRFHGIWHQFYNSPYHFVALQVFAKWLHPDAFADLDPDAVFAEFHERFLPVEYKSGYWASLEPKS